MNGFSKKTLFFAVIAIVGGLVIGLAAGKGISPILLAILGAVAIFIIAMILNILYGEYWFGG
jgi:hypothetical protein